MRRPWLLIVALAHTLADVILSDRSQPASVGTPLAKQNHSTQESNTYQGVDLWLPGLCVVFDLGVPTLEAKFYMNFLSKMTELKSRVLFKHG